jgi:aspartate aminotransferase
MSEEEPRNVVAGSLRARTGIAFRPEDIAMTAGAFGALGVTIRALADEGDEVIFLSPPWFFYELMIASSGATPVRVRLQPPGSTSIRMTSPPPSRHGPGPSS